MMIPMDPAAEADGPAASREAGSRWHNPWLWLLALTMAVAAGFCAALVNGTIGLDDRITAIWAAVSGLVVIFALTRLRRTRPAARDRESGDGSSSSSESGDGDGGSAGGGDPESGATERAAGESGGTTERSDSWGSDGGGGSSDSGGGSESSGSSC